MPKDSERIAAGPKRAPGRNEVVESKGAPKITARASSHELSQPMKPCIELFICL